MPTGFKLGAFTIHYYALLILLGILLGLLLTWRRAISRGKSIDFLIDALPWVFVGGVVGARIWHILSPPQSMVAHGITTRYYLTHLLEAIAIWKGGIGIIGAMAGGGLALWIYSRKRAVQLDEWLDIIAPGLALAQSIGRWGNFINQEVYGLPSNLPWAIFIDPQHRMPGYADFSTYHPLFFYEAIWSFLNMLFILWIGRKYKKQLKTGSLFLIYLIFYGVGRVGLEFLRLDVSTWQGVNLNQTAMLVVVITACFLLYNRQKDKYEAPEQV
jgi:phosphatidylglycerol---prolipoprotein diacylglyceryl transferase